MNTYKANEYAEPKKNIKQIFCELYNIFLKRIDDDLILREKKMGEDASICSLEMISLAFARCIRSDIFMVLKLMEQKKPHRYYDGIIRNMCEQVLEYLNVCDNPNVINEFLGINKDDSEIEAIMELGEVTALRKLIGDKRFSSTHNISNIAKSVGEYHGTDEKLSLYEVYQYESTLYHNAYLMEYYDMVATSADSEKKDEVSGEMGIPYIMLIMILTRFIDKYNEVMETSSEDI